MAAGDRMSWFDDHYQPARENVDYRHTLEARGTEFQNKHGDAWLLKENPIRTENTCSLYVYSDHLFDYGSKEKHDLLDWLERGERLSSEDAQKEAARILNIPAPSANGKARVTINGEPQGEPRASQEPHEGKQDKNWIEDLTAQAHAALKRAETPTAKRAWDYLEARGLSTVVDILRLGVVDESVSVRQAGSAINSIRGRLLIPTLEDGVATFYNARDLTGARRSTLNLLNARRPHPSMPTCSSGCPH